MRTEDKLKAMGPILPAAPNPTANYGSRGKKVGEYLFKRNRHDRHSQPRADHLASCKRSTRIVL